MFTLIVATAWAVVFVGTAVACYYVSRPGVEWPSRRHNAVYRAMMGTED